MAELVAVDGPPGSGKTTTIVQRALNGEADAIVTYTRSAAAELHRRLDEARMAPEARPVVGTIYSLTWPLIPGGKITARSAGGGTEYRSRRIGDERDHALSAYEEDAPSRRALSDLDGLAKAIHRWRPAPPLGLDLKARGPLTYVLPLARWVAGGCEGGGVYGRVIVDEAQDMSRLELEAALGLARETVTCYGDPGQAIFAGSKGLEGADLPAAWQPHPGAKSNILDRGFRVGDPVASLASRVLAPYWRRPAETFRAPHLTRLRTWEPTIDDAPPRGLVLGYSRYSVTKYFREWRCEDTAIVPDLDRADERLVMCTGHAAKGAEADNVYLLPWSAKALGRLSDGDPAALRLAYVMLTRARRCVHVPATLLARLER